MNKYIWLGLSYFIVYLPLYLILNIYKIDLGSVLLHFIIVWMQNINILVIK